MIVVQLAGGLGNQMFQYAAGRAFARQHAVPLALDLSYYSRPGVRQYQLDHFNIQARPANIAETSALTGASLRGFERLLFSLQQRCRPYYRRSVVSERHVLHHDRLMARISSNVYLSGYWQNANYFSDSADQIRAEFTLRDALSAGSGELAARIKLAHSVGVHVRRGDYASDVNTNRLHGTCSVEYYVEAARRMADLVPNAQFFVFSDDPAWAAQHLRLPREMTVVDQSHNNRDYEDMHLLSLCQHFILANSTFSWWAEWLSANPARVVFAPQRWFATDVYDASSLIPAAWHRL